MEKIRFLILKENGLETVEWAATAALITIGLVTTISAIGSTVMERFQLLLHATGTN
jgi:Flp pilus assembly pilin Flp